MELVEVCFPGPFDAETAFSLMCRQMCRETVAESLDAASAVRQVQDWGQRSYFQVTTKQTKNKYNPAQFISSVCQSVGGI